MKPTKIIKTERTDADVDNSIYTITTYEEVIDDEGITHDVAKITTELCTEYDARLLEKKEKIEEEIGKAPRPSRSGENDRG